MQPEPKTADVNDSWGVQYRLKRNRFTLDEANVRSRVAKDKPGIYAIWIPTVAIDVFRCSYVGMSSTDIRGRLLAHLRDAQNDQLHRDLRHFEGFATFSFEYAKDGRDAKALETAMIKWLSPQCNIAENR